MSLWRSDHFVLGVATGSVALARVPLRAVDVTSLPVNAADWLTLGATLAGQLPKGAELSVTIADNLVRYLLIDPPAGMTSLRDARLWLAARFEAVYGESAADWYIDADWQIDKPTLACALPNMLMLGLRPLKLRSVVPALLRHWNRACHRLPATGLWCILDAGLLQILLWERGALRLVRQVRVAGGLPAEDLQRILAQELVRIEAPMPERRFWSGPHVPSGWSAIPLAPEGLSGLPALAWQGAGA